MIASGDRPLTGRAADGSDGRGRRAARRVTLTAGALALGLTAWAAALTASAAQLPVAGRHAVVLVARPGDDIELDLQNLTAGDVLELAPGSYPLGVFGPNLHAGTAAARITVTAADPARPPLLQGSFRFRSPQYWTISHLRLQAAVPGMEAIAVEGNGTGWELLDNEIFGAAATGAYANLSIPTVVGADGAAAGRQHGFRISGNCIHGAGRSARVNTDHNLYLAFPGDATTSGLVDHNLIFDAPNGAGIKLGLGGIPGALGPWGVTVAYNTIVDNGREILLHADVRHNAIYANLLGIATTPFSHDPRTTAIYANLLTTRTNAMAHNYVWGASMVVFDPNGNLVDQGDDALHPDPRLTHGLTCSASAPALAAASAYGWTGSGRFGR